MAWLHENKESFFDAVNLAAERYNVLPTVVEKDYYVTMILRGLSSRLDGSECSGIVDVYYR